MGDRLRQLWDFADLAGTEQRLTSQLDAEPTPAGRAEVLTQLTRVQALRGDFASADELLDQVETLADTPVVKARVSLERGRVRRSSGDPAAALPLFESAYAIADTAADVSAEFLTVDAAHMVALVLPATADRREWTDRAIKLAQASSDPEVSRWQGSLYNNLGWDHYADGEHQSALAAFERALAVREREPDRAAELQLARYAVAKALRALDRCDDAVPLLEQAVAWTVSVQQPDGWFHEELAESYAAVGRHSEAAEQARLGLSLLPGTDPSFETDPVRAQRLRSLAEHAGS